MWRRTALAFILATLVGCTGSKRAAVSGMVLVDNEPLAEGSINFFPDGIQGPSIGAIVKDGEYDIPQSKGVVVGKNRVEIRGFRRTGRKLPDLWDKSKIHDEQEPAVPPEYNEKSTLIRDVQADDNVFDFELTGIKKAK